MSKFLEMVDQNNPDLGNKEMLLSQLTHVLGHIGYKCTKTDGGIHISVEKEESDEDATDKALTRAANVFRAADSMLPKQKPGLGTELKALIGGPFGTQQSQIFKAKKEAMDAITGAVRKASQEIKTALGPM